MPCQAWHRLVECTVLLNQRCPYCTTTLMTHSFFASCIFGDVSTGAASRGRQREGSRGGMVSMTNAGWGAAFFLLNTSEVMLVWLARAAMSGLHACGGPWPTGQPYGPLSTLWMRRSKCLICFPFAFFLDLLTFVFSSLHDMALAKKGWAVACQALGSRSTRDSDTDPRSQGSLGPGPGPGPGPPMLES